MLNSWSRLIHWFRMVSAEFRCAFTSAGWARPSLAAPVLQLRPLPRVTGQEREPRNTGRLRFLAEFSECGFLPLKMASMLA